MRPTIAEQLRETRRILSDILVPQIKDAYSIEIMRIVLSNMEMIEGAWAHVLPFLHWDNTATLVLLLDLQGHVQGDLASAIAEAGQAPPDDPFDTSALQARNAALQALLHRAISQCGREERRAIQAQLLERTARYPMRPIKAAPVPARETGQD